MNEGNTDSGRDSKSKEEMNPNLAMSLCPGIQAGHSLSRLLLILNVTILAASQGGWETIPFENLLVYFTSTEHKT